MIIRGWKSWVARTALSAQALAWTARADDGFEFFEKQVRPVLAERCYACHSATAPRIKGGLRLDSREALLRGGDSGPAVVAGEPAASRLVDAIGYGNVDLQMPPKGRLSEAEIAAVVEWVRQGALWPAEPELPALPATAASAEQGFDLAARKRSHWSWQPIDAATPPPVNAREWVRQPTDAFLLARLEAEGLEPAPAAEPRERLRRLHFDLLGLPPSPGEVMGFAAHPTPAAWAQSVDTLLASRHFGERWARHWLDLVRYAETLGHEFDYALPNAWRYRDYVIRAFNDDVPYDQFAREHIAGDLLVPPRRHPATGDNESVIGTAFYWLGQRPHSPVDVKQHQADVVDDQMDVLTKTFLGLTVACARCHDHKFDAVSTRDYYALYGILSSSRYAQRSLQFAESGDAPMGAHRDHEPSGRLEACITLRPSPLPCGAAILAANQGRLEACTTRLAGLRRALHASLRVPASASSLGAFPAESPDVGRRVFADFSSAGYDGWFTEGPAFGEGPAPAGTWIVLSTNLVSVLDRRVAHSAGVARRLQGILASPTFVISNQFLHVLAAGRASRISVPVENFTMIRDPIYGGLKRWLDHDDFRWVTMDLGRWQGRRAFVQFTDASTPDLAEDGRPEGHDLDGYLAVAAVLFSDHSQPPEPDAGLACARSVPLAEGSAAAAIAAEFRAGEQGLADPPRAPGMMEGTGLDETVFVRGNPRNPGERVPRRFLEALASDPARFETPGSGRLELARAITDPDNPLFARVLVNRVWLHLFGRGLVSTPDDFGALGQAPSHPELLDWLAHWFRTDGGWSVKRLVRLLATSNAYQMSSRPADAAAEELDPENRLWHRMPIRRLEGEAIRDAILAVSGRLDPAPFGPSVPIHLTEFMDGRGRPGQSGPLDGAGRRSIYVEVRRNFLSPMMRAFDAPVPFTTVGRRPASNVPAQSLILLNDPFVQGAAACWARRVLSAGPVPAEARIDAMYRRALGRAPTSDELRLGEAFIDSQADRYRRDGGAAAGDERVWADYAHVLFNLKEFIYIP